MFPMLAQPLLPKLWDGPPETTERTLGQRGLAGLILDTLAVEARHTGIMLDTPNGAEVVMIHYFNSEEIVYELGYGPAASRHFSINEP